MTVYGLLRPTGLTGIGAFVLVMFVMKPLPSRPAEFRPDDPDWRARMLDRQLRMLGELAEMGLDIACAIEAKGRAPGGDPAAAELACARLSRSVEKTIALQSRLIRRGLASPSA